MLCGEYAVGLEPHQLAHRKHAQGDLRKPGGRVVPHDGKKLLVPDERRAADALLFDVLSRDEQIEPTALQKCGLRLLRGIYLGLKHSVGKEHRKFWGAVPSGAGVAEADTEDLGPLRKREQVGLHLLGLLEQALGVAQGKRPRLV